MKKIIVLLLVFLLTGTELLAFATVMDTDIDLGYISTSFLKQGRESDNTVRYAPWILNYALQTEETVAVDGGEGFQQISDIAVSPVDNNLILFGTDTSGIWRSNDGGQNWLSVNNGVNCWGVHDIIFHPTNKDIAYMIQGAPNSSVSSNQIQERTTLDGLYKTIDGGKSWQQILSVNIRGSLNTNRLIAFDDFHNLYLLTSKGLMKSTDSGNTFSMLYDFSLNYNQSDIINYDLCISGNTIVFTNNTYGVLASTDAGVTWSSKNIISTENVSVYGIDIDPENSSHWLACFGNPYYEVYETFNSGNEWSLLQVGANVSASNGKYPIKIMYGKRNDEGVRRLYMLFARTYTPLRVSTNEGQTWSQASYVTPWGADYSPLYGNAISLECDDADTIFLGVGTIMKSVNGGQDFVVCNTPGYSGANIEEIKFSESGNLYLSVTDRGLYKSSDIYNDEVYPTFQHSRDQNYSSVGDIGIDPVDENHLIYTESADSFALCESFNGGLSWSKISGTEASGAPGLIKFHNDDENIIYSTYYTTKDGGSNWILNNKKIYAVSNVNNDIVYSYDGKILYKSLDCGDNFSQIYTANWKITYVLPDNNNENIVYLGLKNGNVIKLENGQDLVINSNNGLSNIAPYAMAQNPNDANHIVLGGQCVDYSSYNMDYYDNYCKTPGIYETFDGGINWHVVKGMPSMRVVYSLAFSPMTNEILIGGFTGGLIVYDYSLYKKYLLSENSIDENFTVIYNGATQKVTICGRINNENNNNKTYSTLLVMPDETMPKNAEMADIVYLGQVEVDEEGEFEYTFTMPPNCDYGTYSVYLGGSGVYLPGVGNYDNSKFSVVSFEFENSQHITAVANFLNTTWKSENVVMYLVQYKNGGGDANILVDVKAERYTIEGSYNNIVAKKISSSLDEQTDVYRAFLWSDDGTLKPLTSYIENKRNGEK